jgi:hypothetical protein
MRRFAAWLGFDALYKSQPPHRRCFRPAISSHCPPVVKRLFDPLAVRGLKTCQIGKAEQGHHFSPIDDQKLHRREVYRRIGGSHGERH